MLAIDYLFSLLGERDTNTSERMGGWAAERRGRDERERLKRLALLLLREAALEENRSSPFRERNL